MICRLSIFSFFIFILMFLSSCQSAYYAAWEKMGKEKRHLLKDNIEDARSDQQEASEQFKSVLERLREIYGFNGGELEEFYNNLNSDYKECEERAEILSERIQKVEQIASDMFIEWETEINEITNVKLKTQSQQSLQNTKNKYARLNQSMEKAQSSMTPVLGTLKDYVLYVKHNLNARAIGALKQEVGSIETGIGALIKDINKSIKETEIFLETF